MQLIWEISEINYDLSIFSIFFGLSSHIHQLIACLSAYFSFPLLPYLSRFVYIGPEWTKHKRD